MTKQISSREYKKKLRELELVNAFIAINKRYLGWEFDSFSENPDLIYRKDNNLLGFESVIISDSQDSIHCVYDHKACRLDIPGQIDRDKRTSEIENFFSNTLFNHLRPYSMPTVLVFSVIGVKSVSFVDLVNIAKKYKLPRLDMYNISAYYLTNNIDYTRIASAK